MEVKKQRVLLVEDDKEIARLTTLYLEAADFHVDVVHKGCSAIEAIKDNNPDLVLLDLMLPGLCGAEICREARKFYYGIILVLTASSDEMNEVSLFKFGADDFVTKPIRGHALLARIEALLKRNAKDMIESEMILSDSIHIEVNHRIQRASICGYDLELTSAEFELFNLLYEHKGNVVSREMCCQLFRGIDYASYDRSIDMRIASLRRKLKAFDKRKKFIKTIRNKGYLLAV